MATVYESEFIINQVNFKTIVIYSLILHTFGYLLVQITYEMVQNIGEVIFV